MKHQQKYLLAAFGVALLTAMLMTGCSREAKQSRHIARGDEYFQKDQFAKAEIEYLNALRLAPTNAAVTRKLVDLYYEQGRSVSALRALQYARQQQPNDAHLQFKLAQVLFSLQFYSQARTQALFVCTNQPTNAAALLILAETSLTSNQVAESRQIISQIAQKAGAHSSVPIALAALDLRMGDLRSAEQQLTRARDLKADPVMLDVAWAKLHIARTNLAEAEVLLRRAVEIAPPRSFVHLQWISFRLLRGDLAGAKEAAQEATRRSADYIPPWVRLAEIALIEKRYEDCDEITKKVLRLDGGSFEALLLRVRMWGAQGLTDNALEELNRLDTLYPQNPGILFELAAIHVNAGRVPKAMALLDEALKINPQFDRATLLKAELNLRNRNPNAAVTSLSALVKDRPEMKEAAVMLVRAYEAQGNHDAALKLSREIVARYPKDPDTSALLGVLLLGSRDLAGARAAFEKSTQISPTYLPAVQHLIDMDLRATNFPSALARAAQITRLATNSAVGPFLEAKVHMLARDYKAAEEALNKAAAREPNSMTVYSAFASLYYETKDFEKSLAKLDGLIKQNPKADAAWLQKGLIYAIQGESKKAAEAYRQAITINGSSAVALNNLAYMLSEDPKQLDEAFSLASKARQAAPQDGSIADTLGWILFKRGDYASARRLLAESAEKLKNAEVEYHLARAEYALGDDDSARQHFTTALQGNIPKELRADAESRLAVLNVDIASATPNQIKSLETAVQRDANDFNALIRLGAIYRSQGNTNKAVSTYESAARANPQSALPPHALAQIYADRDLKRALQLARDARKLAPGDPSIGATLGSLSVRNHEYPAAYTLLLESVRAGTATPAVQYDFAVAQFALGRLADATATLQSLATADPALKKRAEESRQLLTASHPARPALAQSRLQSDAGDIFALVAMADIEDRQNRHRDAVRAYEKVLASSPDFWPARKRLALLYAGPLDDPQAAYPHALKAREVAPDDSEVSLVLGRLALKRNDLPGAIRFFEDSTRVNPTNGEPYYFLGLAQFRSGKTNEARLTLAKAVGRPLAPEQATDAKRMMGTE